MTTYSIEYVIERLEKAVRVLAVDFEDARTRLNNALGKLIALPPSEFPEHLQAARAQISASVARFEGREGHITFDNIRKMKKAEVSEVCEMILDLYFALVDYKTKRDVSSAAASRP